MARRKWDWPDERFSGLENVQPGGYILFVAFSDRDLIAKEINGIAADIVDLVDVDDIGAVYFEEVGADQFLFHILECAIRDIVLDRGHEFHIVAHTLEEEDIVFFQFYEFILGLDKEKIGVGVLGRDGGGGCCRRLCGGCFLLQFLDRFLEAFIGKWFFQVVVDMVLEGVEGVFGLGSREDDHGGISEPVQQVETIGAGHLDVEEKQVHPFLVKVFQGLFYIQKMPFYFDEVAFLTEFAKKIRSNLDIFYYNTSQLHLHPKTIKKQSENLILHLVEQSQSIIFFFYNMLRLFFSLNQENILEP